MTEAAVLERTVAALEQLGLTVAARKAPRAGQGLRADAWLRLGLEKRLTDYVVEVKRTVTPTTLGAVVTQLNHTADAAGLPPLLVTGYVTPPMADRLRELDQQFADTAGNAYLAGPEFLVFVTGRKAEQPIAAARTGRAFTAAGLKVMFALICDPELAAAPHRAIAAAADVALGAVPAVLKDLHQHGYLVIAGKRRRLNATKRMLDDWALAYARTLRPKTLLRTLVAPDIATWQEWKLKTRETYWGGEPAAHLLVRHLRPGVLTLYAEKPPGRLIVEQRLTTAEPNARDRLVEIRKPFWGTALRNDTRPDTVPPALVYADLLATGEGRCIETAGIVYDRHLARLFPAT